MGSIYKQKGSSFWWIAYTDQQSQRHWESSRSVRKGDAQRLLRQREGRVAEGKDPGARHAKVTLAELAECLLTDYQVNGKRSLERAEISVRHLLVFFGEKTPAIRITGSEIQAYTLHRKSNRSRTGKPIANATINRELAALKGMFNLAVKNGKLTKSHVPYIESLAERNVRTGFFEHEEFLAVREALPEHLRALVAVAYYTGLRKGELLNLRWEENIDLKQGSLQLNADEMKNAEPRAIPLTGELLATLREHKARRDQVFPECPWVFWNSQGRQIRWLNEAWRAACRKAGCEGKLLHDLRRSAVRNMVRAGVPDSVAMSISGHKTRSVFLRYDITSEADKLDAMRRVDRLHQPKEEKVIAFASRSER